MLFSAQFCCKLFPIEINCVIWVNVKCCRISKTNLCPVGFSLHGQHEWFGPWINLFLLGTIKLKNHVWIDVPSPVMPSLLPTCAGRYFPQFLAAGDRVYDASIPVELLANIFFEHWAGDCGKALGDLSKSWPMWKDSGLTRLVKGFLCQWELD